MKVITQEELKEILEKHAKFIMDKEGGERANLQNADLSSADLSGANLSSADLSGADLSGANLQNADLSGTNLSGADLWRADLWDADLSGADLLGTNLSRANLSNADLSGADLKKNLYDEYTAFFAMCCPEEGSFIGFKRCANNLIVKLLITEEAKRSSATTRKCRCSEAKVLEILTTKRKKAVARKAVSIKDENFVYEVGKIVFVKDFCEDRWEECAAGIHFFLTFDEAVKYGG